MRQIGTYTTDPFIAPATATGLRISLDRTGLSNVLRNRNSDNPLDRLVSEINIERSLDGEQWELAGGMGIEGGEADVGLWRVPGHQIVVATESTLKFHFPQDLVGKNLQLRGVYELFARFRCAADAEWLYDVLPAQEVHHSVSITSYQGGEVSSGTTINVSAQTATGSNTLGVCVCCNSQASGQPLTSVTRNSQVFTEIFDHAVDANDDHAAAYYVSPSAGSFGTAVVFAGTTQGAAGIYMMDGASQGAPIDSAHTNVGSNNSMSVTLTNSVADGMCVAIGKVYTSNDIDPTESGQTEDEQFDQPGGGGTYQSLTRRASTGASTVMGYDWTTNRYADMAAVAVGPAAAGENAKPLVQRTRLQPLVGGGLHQ